MPWETSPTLCPIIKRFDDRSCSKQSFIQVEIMMFTVGNIPTISEDERTMKTSDAILQKVLVKTLLKVRR